MTFLLPRFFAGVLAILALFTAGCAPEAERPSFQTVSLTNRTEWDVAYAISINGSAIPDITLKPKEGVLFHASSATLDPTKATMTNAHGEKLGFRGKNIQLQSVRNGAGGISPQGTFRPVHYSTPKAARLSGDIDWQQIETTELKTIEVHILTDK